MASLLRRSRTVTIAKTGGLKSMQVFDSTSDDTWTKPPGVTIVKVYCTGAGGGGGGSGNSYYDGGGGGGAGGTSIRVFDVSSVATVTLVIGGGSAGRGTDGSTSNQAEDADAGGTSSFAGPGNTITGTGGGGGNDGNTNSSKPGAGGIGTLGQLNLLGGTGHRGTDQGSNYRWRGHGGYSYWGGADDVRIAATDIAKTISKHGNGGSGGSNNSADASLNRGGGNGGDGLIVVEEYS